MRTDFLCHNAFRTMQKMSSDHDDHRAAGRHTFPAHESERALESSSGQNGGDLVSLLHWIPGFAKIKPQEHSHDDEAHGGIRAYERSVLSNIRKMKETAVGDIMIPRADIVAVDVNIEQEDLLNILTEHQCSRLPVYRNTLDDVLGTLHIKDIMRALANGEKLEIRKLITEIPIVSPTMSVIDLLLKMRQSRRHMALVVDEYGGIDGLVTISDIIESIVGVVEDEHDTDDAPLLTTKEDGSVIADGRLDIQELEGRFGAILSEEEREESDTLAGLVFSLAGRIPARGEILTHPSGMVFEIVDADPRRVNRVKIRNIPAPPPG